MRFNYIGKFNAVSLSHKLMGKVLQTGHVVVDATCGNGNDTIFLARAVSQNGHVWAFDIQENALFNARKKVDDLGLSNVTFIHDGHQRIAHYISEELDGLVFNLGYLPSSDKKIITKPTTTKQAIKAAMTRLADNGFICIASYVAHQGGRQEYRSLVRFFKKKIWKNYCIEIYDCEHKKNDAPKVLFVQKQVDF